MKISNNVTVNLSGAIKLEDYKIDILSEGGCSAILPLNILRYNSTVEAVFDVSGYTRLSALRDISAGDILTIAVKTIEVVEECKEHLIFPGEYIVSADTTYIDRKLEQVKLMYIPRESPESEKQMYARFIQSLDALTTENGRTYLEMLGEILSVDGVNPLNILAFVHELKQEIHMCDIV